MGLLATFDRAVRAEAQPGNINDHWYNEYQPMSDAGIPITTQTAMRISTFWKCVRWKASMYGMLPKKVYERIESLGRQAQRPAPEHPLYPIVHNAPNPLTTSMRFSGMIEHDFCTEGNFYAFKQRNLRTAQLESLWRFRPGPAYARTEVEYFRVGGQKQWRLWYIFTDEQGEEHRFYPDEILHLRLNVGKDGITGYSPIRMQMNLLGWARATQRYGAQFFKKASRHSGLLIAENGIDPDKKDELIESLKATGRNAGALGLVEGGLKYQQLTMTQDEAQFIQTMEFQDEDICGIMNVKPHKVGILRHMTNNNVEQQNIEAVTDSLQPDCVLIEQDMDLQLLDEADRERFFNQAELKALLRGDTAAQTAHLVAMRDRGIYDGNDCAEYLGNAPFEGGDIRVINRAFGPLEDIHDWSQVSQNNPPPARDNNSQEQAEHLRPLFRDAAGRVIGRKEKKDRARAVESIFGPILITLAGCLGSVADTAFLAGYLASMGQRAMDWVDPETVTSEEFERALAAFGRRDDA